MVNKHNTLSSNPSTTRREKKEKEKVRILLEDKVRHEKMNITIHSWMRKLVNVSIVKLMWKP
jgi:hypothetical protein